MKIITACRAYLAKLPPSISGSGGHNALFTAACWCVRFGLADSDGMALLREWNGTHCQPPWTENELAHKLADARKRVAMPAGHIAPEKPVSVIWPRTAPRRFTVQEKILLPDKQPPVESLPACGLAPISETVPYYTSSGDLVIPFASPLRFHYWKKRAPSDAILTLAEIMKNRTDTNDSAAAICSHLTPGVGPQLPQ